MSDHILSTDSPVTLIGAGEATSEDIYAALTLAPTAVAADGGAALALHAGVDLAAVIGDFDSLPEEDRARLPDGRMHLIAEQETTDFEKALSRVAAPVLLGVGFLGRRVDHQLAAFHTLMRYPERACVLIGAEDIVCLAPPQIVLPTQEGERVSLFPMAEVQGQSRGLTWPIDGLKFAPGARVGTSNRAEGPVTLKIDQPSILLILPRRLLPFLVEALVEPKAARWPAHVE